MRPVERKGSGLRETSMTRIFIPGSVHNGTNQYGLKLYVAGPAAMVRPVRLSFEGEKKRRRLDSIAL